jgi:hypothetical protein
MLLPFVVDLHPGTKKMAWPENYWFSFEQNDI